MIVVAELEPEPAAEVEQDDITTAIRTEAASNAPEVEAETETVMCRTRRPGSQNRKDAKMVVQLRCRCDSLSRRLESLL